MLGLDKLNPLSCAGNPLQTKPALTLETELFDMALKGVNDDKTPQDIYREAYRNVYGFEPSPSAMSNSCEQIHRASVWCDRNAAPFDSYCRAQMMTMKRFVETRRIPFTGRMLVGPRSKDRWIGFQRAGVQRYRDATGRMYNLKYAKFVRRAKAIEQELSEVIVAELLDGRRCDFHEAAEKVECPGDYISLIDQTLPLHKPTDVREAAALYARVGAFIRQCQLFIPSCVATLRIALPFDPLPVYALLASLAPATVRSGPGLVFVR